MSWRTLVITRRCKLDLNLNYLEIRSEEVKKIHLSELHTVIIESTAVSMTAALLNEMIHRKIKVIFCDEKRNPSSELIPFYGTHDSSARIRQQISWDGKIKGMVWTEIVAEKIRQQQGLLIECGEFDKARKLGEYIDNIIEADANNREGHAARIYFTGLFGIEFSRSQDNPINSALNYGYSILLSSFNKEIAAAGYLTQIGIFHDNMFNPFNLASYLMEPFRPLIDRIVWKNKPEKFEKPEKLRLLEIMEQKVIIDHQTHFVPNAIRIFTYSIIEAINDKKTEKILFYEPCLEGKGSEAIKATKVEMQDTSSLQKRLNEVRANLQTKQQ